MKRIFILLCLFFVISLSCSCEKSKENVNSKEKVESSSNQEDIVEYEYEKYLYENLIWGENKQSDWVLIGEEKPGNIVRSVLLQELIDKYRDKEIEDKKFVVTFIVVTDDTRENVFKYLKANRIETEFDEFTDEELDVAFKEMEYMFSCITYMSEEQIESLQCPDDYEIVLFETNRFKDIHVTENAIDWYKQDIFPVYYYNKKGEKVRNYFNRSSVLSMIEQENYKFFWDWELFDYYRYEGKEMILE